jgi:chemotaxis protein CheC
MIHPEETFNDQLFSFMQYIAQEGIKNAALGFSSMLDEEVNMFDSPQVKSIPVVDIPKIMGGPEKVAVGIYVRAIGEISGQIMMILSYPQALELVKLLLGDEPIEMSPNESCPVIGRMERSALAEIGNLTASFFLNKMAELTNLDLRPSPPAVIVDMIGAILDIVVASTGGIYEHVLILQSTFLCGDRKVDTDFIVIPDQIAIEAFLKKEQDGVN